MLRLLRGHERSNRAFHPKTGVLLVFLYHVKGPPNAHREANLLSAACWRPADYVQKRRMNEPDFALLLSPVQVQAQYTSKSQTMGQKERFHWVVGSSQCAQIRPGCALWISLSSWPAFSAMASLVFSSIVKLSSAAMRTARNMRNASSSKPLLWLPHRPYHSSLHVLYAPIKVKEFSRLRHIGQGVDGKIPSFKIVLDFLAKNNLIRPPGIAILPF